MDDFLMKLYNEELEKNAGAGQKHIFDALPVSDLENFLGLDKVAVGGHVEPEVSPAFKKAFQARETKGKETQREAIKEHSSSESQVERNIAPLKAGQTIPERNISPQAPQVSASAKTLPDREYATQGETKQAAIEWADQMGRALAHMTKEGSFPFVKEGAELTQAQRNKLPSKSFAVPKNKAKKLGVAHEIQGKAKGKYPIPDEAHARNALARVAQYGTPGEKAAVRAKVHAKFPGIGEGKGEEKDSCAMGKAACAMRSIKLARQLPPEMMPGLISATASRMVKEAKLHTIRPKK